jgi:hypothetical protein
MHPRAPKHAGMPPEELDELGLEDSVLDEIMQYARGKEADGLKSKFAPPPAEEEVPGAVPEEGALEGEGLAGEGLAGEGEISAEDLEALLARLGE